MLSVRVLMGMKVIIEEYQKKLEKLAMRKGFTPIREFSTKGNLARIDQVWLKNGKPVWAFEIEAGWRTKKHYKGDLFNFLLLRAEHSIVLLSREGCKTSKEGWDEGVFESHLTRIIEYIKEAGLADKIRVWTEKELNEFAGR